MSQVIKQNVGTDISKDDFKVCFYQLSINKKMTQKQTVKGSRTFKNTIKGFEKFHAWMEAKRDKNIVIRITMEATGIYYEQLVHYLNDHQENVHISVVLPNMSKNYFKSLNIKSKTDKIDAKVLGQMGLERELKKWEPISEYIRGLKQLTRDRVGILVQKTAASNRLHAVTHSYAPSESVIKRLKEQIDFLTKQIKAVEKEIEEIINQDDFLSQRVENICEVKGVGVATLATIIAETGGFELFSSRGQVMSYAGYDIVQNESGSSIKGQTRISKKGNKFIRRALYFPALSVVKYDKNFKQVYDRVFDRSKIKMKAYVAVQRKLLILIYTLFKKNEKYDSNFKKESNPSRTDLTTCKKAA